MRDEQESQSSSHLIIFRIQAEKCRHAEPNRARLPAPCSIFNAVPCRMKSEVVLFLYVMCVGDCACGSGIRCRVVNTFALVCASAFASGLASFRRGHPCRYVAGGAHTGKERQPRLPLSSQAALFRDGSFISGSEAGGEWQVGLFLRSSVLVDLGFEAIFDLGLGLCLFGNRSYLALEPFPRPQNLALQVEAAALFRVVLVEELLEAAQHLLVRDAVLGRVDVEDAARLVDGHAAGKVGAAGARGGAARVGLGMGAGELGRRLRLLVGGEERAADDPGPREDDLANELVRLQTEITC